MTVHYKASDTFTRCLKTKFRHTWQLNMQVIILAMYYIYVCTLIFTAALTVVLFLSLVQAAVAVLCPSPYNYRFTVNTWHIFIIGRHMHESYCSWLYTRKLCT